MKMANIYENKRLCVLRSEKLHGNMKNNRQTLTKAQCAHFIHWSSLLLAFSAAQRVL